MIVYKNNIVVQSAASWDTEESIDYNRMLSVMILCQSIGVVNIN